MGSDLRHYSSEGSPQKFNLALVPRDVNFTQLMVNVCACA